MNRASVTEKLTRALDKLVRDDAHLLEIDANERSISHRLAVYLESEFTEWHIDCEYNRDIEDPKRLNIDSIRTDSTDTQGRTVFPDIIVHVRGQANNLLVIEMKKTSSGVPDDFDHAKLAAFRRELGYQHAAFIKVITRSETAGYEPIVWL
ncbi:hypothetical protein [Vibrio vulnificus]|uniref:hypothetical protein n=1 Tax=Vibrio vulnificus TaxID=672 RepID=UPI003045BC77